MDFTELLRAGAKHSARTLTKQAFASLVKTELEEKGRCVVPGLGLFRLQGKKVVFVEEEGVYEQG